MRDEADGVTGVRMTRQSQREIPHHSTSLALPRSSPPPLRPAPQRTSHKVALCYRCLPADQHPQQPFTSSNKHLLHHGRSVIELALLVVEDHSDVGSAHEHSVGNDLSLMDMHAFFSRPLSTPSSLSPLRIAHHPVFVRRCPRLRYCLFDFVCHRKGYMSGQHEDNNAAQQQLREALRLALTAHTGEAAMASAGVTVEAEESDSLPLCHVVEQLHGVLSRFIPMPALPSMALGLTMTSAGLHVGVSGRGPICEGAAAPIHLRWSWVEAPSVEADDAQGSSSRTAAGPASLATSTSETPLSTHFESLWQHWLSTVTANEDAGGVEEYSRCSNAFSAYRRLREYAKRSEHLLLGSDINRIPSTSEQQEAETLLCALLAVLAEAQRHEEYWASPLTPLSVHDPHTLDRYTLVWFTFIGLAMCRGAAEMQIQTNVQAILLSQAATDEESCCISTPHSKFDVPMHVRLRCMCEWITTKIMAYVLQWLPPTLFESAAAAPLPNKLNETHLLFRGVSVTPRGISSLVPRYQQSLARTRHQCVPARIPFLHASAAQLHRTLDQLLECVTGTSFLTRSSTFTQRVKWQPPIPALTRELFTHPAQHGVVVCRLHLYVPLGSHVFASPKTVRHPSSTIGARVVRSPVAALLSWYAVDFEDVFRQSYRCWLLSQRYGALPTTQPSVMRDCSASYNCARSCEGSSAVDPAVVCYGGGNDLSAGERSAKDVCIGVRRSSAFPVALGLLGRCLLLGLWMMLKLTDVDLEDGDVGTCSSDRNSTGASNRMREEDSSQAVPTRGTLFYSSRRSMLFARDWQTVQQLHRVLISTSAIGVDGTRWPASPTPTETLDTRSAEAVGEAAASVVHAFMAARLAQQQIRERHQRIAAVALHRRLQMDHRKQELLLVEADRSRGAAHQGNGATDKSSPRATALDLSSAEDEEEPCALLHWSVEEDAALPSVGSAEAVLIQATTHSADASVDSVSNEYTPTYRTPAGDVQAELSFTVSVHSSSVQEAGGASPLSPPPASVKSMSPSTSSGPLVPPALSLEQRHMLDLEAQERALLWREELCDVLWLTSLQECVERRTCEEREAGCWKKLTVEEEQCKQSQKARRAVPPRDNSSMASFCELQLHNDERVPVTALMSLASSPPPVPPAQVVALTAPQLAQFAGTLRSDEEQVRGVLQHVECRQQRYLCTERLHRRAHGMLLSQEAQQRRFLMQICDVQQKEWQARWSTLVLPECVLRELYRDGFQQAQPVEQPESLVDGEAGEPTLHAFSKAPDPYTSSPPIRALAPSSRPNSTSKRATPTAVEAAEAHRAFLLQEEAEQEALVQPALPRPSRRSAPPTPQPRKDCKACAAAPPMHPKPLSHPPVLRTAVNSEHNCLRPATGPSKLSGSGKGGSPSPRQDDASPPPSRLSAPVALRVLSNARSASSVPIVSVSLRTDTGDGTSLPEPHVYSPPKMSSAHLATADLGTTSGRYDDPSVCPAAAPGRWCAPLNGDDAGEEEGMPCSTPHTQRQQLRRKRPLASAAIFRNPRAAKGPGSKQTTTLRFREKANVEMDVTSAVAAAIALACGNGSRESGPMRAARTASNAHLLRSTGEGSGVVEGRPPRLSRKRHVTWAGDVQDF
ncbi:hypothetical protein ABL78_6328 [Leptomonas seymouri]|uniref:Uncharacterized protein n=1 Tax=Leptomonas seymouri TaxID=5684 RepID=A0A0N1HTW9_LEPSE|nr:hypothetical protein ABL78_6328 [Leptomonas seymouri]|eukprot:KPI84623.1 hypothetical protein ABL78_6328 [Leptomonas seymouri]